MYEAKDKVFFITGAAVGIGAGMSRSFLKEGAKHVAALDLDDNNGTALQIELSTIYGKDKIQFYKCDVTTKDLDVVFNAICKQFGTIDVVINNAGIMNDSPEMYEKEIAVNVTALVTSSLKAYNLMRKDHGGKGGTIVNVSSIAGLYSFPCVPIYCGTKSAVLQFSKCLGNEIFYSTSGVRIITMCFGATNTDLLRNVKSIDKESNENGIVGKVLSAAPVQSVESAAAGAMEVFKRGSSGSTWLINNNKPAKDISDNIQKADEIMSQGVFE